MSPATVEARREAGVCIDCGAERTGDGITKLRCSRCSERVRTAARAWYERNRDRPRPEPDPTKKRDGKKARADERRASGLCTECGQSRDPSGETLLCKPCREKGRARCAAHRQRKRNAAWEVTDRDIAPLPIGRALPALDDPRPFFCRLDFEAYRAVLELKRRYRERETAAGRRPQPYQISRLVRAAVRQFARRDVPLRRHGRFIQPHRLTVYLDAETRGILERQAATRFNGSKSEAMRAMICYAAFPFVVGAVGGPRRYRDIG